MSDQVSQPIVSNDSAHRTALMNWMSGAMSTMASPLEQFKSSDGSIAKLMNALAGCGGVRLYKYQPYSERNIQDFMSSSLHLSPVTTLNDRFEGYIRSDKEFSKHALESLSSLDGELAADFVDQVATITGHAVCEQDLESIRALINDKESLSASMNALDSTLLSSVQTERWIHEMRQSQRCGSLSKTPLSASMWDRYADCHKGFVTGYGISEYAIPCSCQRGLKATCNNAPLAILCPVVYGEETPSLGPLYVAWLAMEKIGASVKDVVVLYNVLSLCHKSSFWSNEMEWRIIANAGWCSNNQLYAYMKPDSIYLGVSMDNDERLRVIEAAVDIGITQIYDMVIPENAAKYSLETVPVDPACLGRVPCWSGIG